MAAPVVCRWWHKYFGRLPQPDPVEAAIKDASVPWNVRDAFSRLSQEQSKLNGVVRTLQRRQDGLEDLMRSLGRPR